MLDLVIQDDAERRTVSVGGEVDLSTSPELWKQVRVALRGTRMLRIRLADVSYIDSTGIAVLVQSYRAARQQNIDLALLDPSPKVLAVIELARLADVFTIETTV